jgi:hypothetical protein
MSKPPSSPRRGNPGLDAPGGWSTSRHYYVPREIKLVPGVSQKSCKYSRTRYHGKAEDLIASHIITADMLPPEGRISINWNTEDKTDGRAATITRCKGGMFTVEVNCSWEEWKRRKAAEQQGQQATDGEERILTDKEQKLLEVYGKMPDSFKPVAVRAVTELGRASSDAETACWRDIWRACCAASNHGAPAAQPSRGHLRLAWSAPEAPAWTTDL